MEQLTENIKKEIWEHFEDFQTIYLATIDGDTPRVRPVTLASIDSKFWILTGTNDAKIHQLLSNPKFEFCHHFKDGDNSGYVRAAGSVKIILNQSIRTGIAEKVHYFKDYWKSTEDPSYTLIEMDFKEIEYMRPGEMLAQKYCL